MYTDKSGSAPESVENAGVGNTCLEAALDGARRGWSMIPFGYRCKDPAVLIDGTEKPTRLQWKKYQTNPPDASKLRDWYKQRPDAGVAIMCGSGSGIVGIDVDGPEADLVWQEITNGEIFPTWTMWTTKNLGKYRLLFRCDRSIRSVKLLGRSVAAGAVVGECAVKADKLDGTSESCVIIPPSVHPNGHSYEWQPGYGPDDFPDGPMMLPEWLRERFELASKIADEAKAKASSPAKHPSAPYQEQQDEPPGDWLNRQFPDELLRRWGFEFTRENEQRFYKRIGSENPVGATAKIGSDGKWNIQVHSTSVSGLPSGHYDPFGLLARLDHDGDVAKAASAARILRDGLPAFENVTIDVGGCLVDEIGAGATPSSMPTNFNAPRKGFSLLPVGDMKPTKFEWLSPNALFRGAVQMWVGESKDGKTSVARAMCAHLASGRGVMATPGGKPARILWVVHEDDPTKTMKPACIAEAITRSEANNILFPSENLCKGLTTPEGIDALAATVEENDIDLVIVDTFSKLAVANGLDPNSANGARAILDPLANLVLHRLKGLTVLVLHHVNKNTEQKGITSVQGSTQVAAAVRVVFRVEKASDGGSTTLSLLDGNTPKFDGMLRFKIENMDCESIPDRMAFLDYEALEEGFLDEAFAKACIRQNILEDSPQVDIDGGVVVVGRGNRRIQEAAESADRAERELIAFLRLSGGKASLKASMACLARKGVSTRFANGAVDGLEQLGRIRIAAGPGRGSPKTIELAPELSEMGGVDAYGG